MMKRLTFMLLLMCLLATPALAQDYNFKGTATWEQTASDLSNLDRWVLYLDHNATVYEIAIPYDGSPGPFTQVVEQVIIANYEEVVTIVAHMTAVDKWNRESGPSNHVTVEFTVPLPDDITPPQRFQFTFELTITP